MQYCHPADVDTLFERCVAALRPGGRVVHGDVIDRALLPRLYLGAITPGGLARFTRARLRPRAPIWRDGSFAHDLSRIADRLRSGGSDVALVPARCAYRRHVVVTA